MSVKVGKVYKTPWEPHGLFRVVRIKRPSAWVDGSALGVFVGDHPKGYKDGSFGRYPTKELEGRDVDIAE